MKFYENDANIAWCIALKFFGIDNRGYITEVDDDGIEIDRFTYIIECDGYDKLKDFTDDLILKTNKSGLFIGDKAKWEINPIK